MQKPPKVAEWSPWRLWWQVACKELQERKGRYRNYGHVMDGGDGDGRVRMEYSCLFRGSLDGAVVEKKILSKMSANARFRGF